MARCSRCGSILVKSGVNGLGRTAAFSLAALILYVPANIYPILGMDLYGAHSENTVWEGSKALFQKGEILVAVIVFLAVASPSPPPRKDPAIPPAKDGTIFVLRDNPEKEWLKWTPKIALPPAN